jgi:hypothetical protein
MVVGVEVDPEVVSDGHLCLPEQLQLPFDADTHYIDMANMQDIDCILDQPYFNHYDYEHQHQQYLYEELPKPKQQHQLPYERKPLNLTTNKTTRAFRGRSDQPLNDDSDDDMVEGGPQSENGHNRRSFSPNVKHFLIRWLHRYSDNPYPSARIKNRLAAKCGLSVAQVEVIRLLTIGFFY